MSGGGGKGYLGSEELAFTISTRQDQSIMQPIILDDQGGSVMNVYEDGIAGTLRAQTHGHLPIVYDTTQITSPQNGSNPQPGDPAPPLVKNGHPPLLIEEHKVFQQNQREEVRFLGETGEQAGAIVSQPGMHNQNFLLSVTEQPTAYSIQGNIIGRQEHNGGNGRGIAEEVCGTLTKTDRHGVAYKDKKYMVRRLTPKETLRLQGFPDDYLDIPGATDSKKYEAVGNSMTINVMEWIGDRINKVVDIQESLKKCR